MYLNGEAQTVQQLIEAWESGAVMRFNWTWDCGTVAGICPIVNFTYGMMSGSMQGRIFYLDSYTNNSTISSYSII